MFKVGTKYEFRLIEGGDEIMFWGVIEAYEHPLVKLEDVDPSTINIIFRSPDGPQTQTLGTKGKLPGRIINVTSPSFVSAVEHS